MNQNEFNVEITNKQGKTYVQGSQTKSYQKKYFLSGNSA